MIRGVVFDLDGTLADTERLQWQAYRRVLLGYDVDIGLDEYRRHWIAVDGGPEYACRTYGLPLTPAELRAQKGLAYRELIQDGVRAMRGAREALERLGANRSLAVATDIPSSYSTAHIWPSLAGSGAGSGSGVWVGSGLSGGSAACGGSRTGVGSGAGNGSGCGGWPGSPSWGGSDAGAGLAAGMRVIAVPSDLTFDNDFTGASARLKTLADLTDTLLAKL